MELNNNKYFLKKDQKEYLDEMNRNWGLVNVDSCGTGNISDELEDKLCDIIYSSSDKFIDIDSYESVERIDRMWINMKLHHLVHTFFDDETIRQKCKKFIDEDCSDTKFDVVMDLTSIIDNLLMMNNGIIPSEMFDDFTPRDELEDENKNKDKIREPMFDYGTEVVEMDESRKYKVEFLSEEKTLSNSRMLWFTIDGMYINLDEDLLDDKKINE